jgi:hypothetical protein
LIEEFGTPNPRMLVHKFIGEAATPTQTPVPTPAPAPTPTPAPTDDMTPPVGVTYSNV